MEFGLWFMDFELLLWTEVDSGIPTGPLTILKTPGSWHFDNGTTRKIDNVLLEHGGLPHVLPLAVHLRPS